MRKRMLASMAAVIAWVAIASCRLPPPDSGVGRVIDCGSEAVQKRWPAVLAPLNSCLTGAAAGVSGCLLGLINPAAGVTYDVIVCLTRQQGSTFAHAAQANPKDRVSAQAAENARRFLDEQKVVFAK